MHFSNKTLIHESHSTDRDDGSCVFSMPKADEEDAGVYQYYESALDADGGGGEFRTDPNAMYAQETRRVTRDKMYIPLEPVSQVNYSISLLSVVLFIYTHSA